MTEEEKKAIKNYICKIDWNKGTLTITSKDTYLEDVFDRNHNNECLIFNPKGG